jgi:hypothetical protein
MSGASFGAKWCKRSSNNNELLLVPQRPNNALLKAAMKEKRVSSLKKSQRYAVLLTRRVCSSCLHVAMGVGNEQ